MSTSRLFQPRTQPIHQVAHRECAGHHAESQCGDNSTVRLIGEIECGAQDRRHHRERLAGDKDDDRKNEKKTEDKPGMPRPMELSRLPGFVAAPFVSLWQSSPIKSYALKPGASYHGRAALSTAFTFFTFCAPVVFNHSSSAAGPCFT